VKALAAAAAIILAYTLTACAYDRTDEAIRPQPTKQPAKQPAKHPAMPASEPSPPRAMPSKPLKPPAPPKIHPDALSSTLDRFLAGRPGRIAATVTDLTTGRAYRYHRSERVATASTVKVEILMALLLATPWHGLDAETRDNAGEMIRLSDNDATDTLWARIGQAEGLEQAGERLGLRDTTAVDGRCLDIYCWGITETSADDQVRLLKQLVTDKGPLKAADHQAVLGLMRQVAPDQKWGISAGACKGDQISIKDGWLHHVSNDKWVIGSIGLIGGHGHTYALAVLTEDNPSMEAGIAKTEDVTKHILEAFRGPQGCTLPR
jgi:beta-lactamase class A